MTTIIIMLTEIAIRLEGLELTSRSRTPLSIAELPSSLACQFRQMQVGQTIGFRRLLGWAFGPRNLMKNSIGSVPGFVGQVSDLPTSSRFSLLADHKNDGLPYKQHDHPGGAARSRASLDSRKK